MLRSARPTTGPVASPNLIGSRDESTGLMRGRRSRRRTRFSKHTQPAFRSPAWQASRWTSLLAKTGIGYLTDGSSHGSRRRETERSPSRAAFPIMNPP